MQFVEIAFPILIKEQIIFFMRGTGAIYVFLWTVTIINLHVVGGEERGGGGEECVSQWYHTNMPVSLCVRTCVGSTRCAGPTGSSEGSVGKLSRPASSESAV